LIQAERKAGDRRVEVLSFQPPPVFLSQLLARTGCKGDQHPQASSRSFHRAFASSLSQPISHHFTTDEVLPKLESLNSSKTRAFNKKPTGGRTTGVAGLISCPLPVKTCIVTLKGPDDVAHQVEVLGGERLRGSGDGASGVPG
jgi:hypothetical protein